MMFVAAVTMMFAACNKDDNGGNTPDQNNMARVGNVVTPLEYELSFDAYGTANINGMYAQENIHVHFGAGIAWESLGKTFDLTTGYVDEDFWFRYEGMATNECQFTHSNYADGTLGTWLNHGERSDNPVFSTGTFSTACTDNGYTLKIEGTLVDGTPVLIKMDVPFTGEIIPLTKNSVIYNGVKYQFTTTAQQDDSTGNVTWNSTGANNVSTSGTIFQGSNNLGIFLEDNPVGDGYHFEFEINTPDIQLSYHWHNNQLTGTINGEPFTSSPFIGGEASISAYHNQMRVTVIGTLNNGKELRLYVDSPY